MSLPYFYARVVGSGARYAGTLCNVPFSRKLVSELRRSCTLCRRMDSQVEISQQPSAGEQADIGANYARSVYIVLYGRLRL